jgi:hypothetical protein
MATVTPTWRFICAVRGPEPKRSFFGNYKEKLSRFWSSCRTWLLIKKSEVVWGLKELVLKEAIKKYCSKGFHKYSPQTISWSISDGKRTIKTSYHECILCRTKMFMTPKDKIKYQQLSSGKRKWFK